MRQRLAYLLKIYAWTVLVFIAAKVVFMLCNREGHAFTVADVREVIAHGLTLDLSTALYFLIVPFLVTAVSVWWQGKALRRVLCAYYLLISVAFALAFVADTSLYPFWGFKLDASCLQYLSTPGEAAASVTGGYLFLRAVALALVAAVVARVYCGVRPPTAPVRRRVAGSALFALLVPGFVIGIRGGVDESTTNIGQVYYSQNQFFNHSAVNPVFSFLASVEKTASPNTVYQFMTDAECARTLQGVYTTESSGCDTLLNTRVPNIIIILLESCGGEFTEIGGRNDVTPNLNRLTAEGVYFTNCYANSFRTDRGTLCTLSGYPSFPTMSVMKMPAKTRQLPNIARTLSSARNYSTHYLYGGDINFTNMRSYLVSGGFERLTWKADYTADEQRTAQWGVRDDITFETLYHMATTLPPPYLIGYSTLSSHEPWDVPERKFDDEVLNAFHYLDQCVGRFIDRLRQTDAWRQTLVVMLPDHGINYHGIDEQHQLKNHIPMLWVGGAVRRPCRIETLCNQTDLPATLLGQLGLPHTEFTFSRDVLSQTYTRPFAFHTFNNGFSMVDSTGFTVYDLHARQTSVRGSDADRQVKLGQAILQATSTHLQQLGNAAAE